MKTIKIHINRLGAVRNSVVELKPLMIFSGESGLGKSYVAILVHYFYKVLAETRLQALSISSLQVRILD
jgi:predicted ATPase